MAVVWLVVGYVQHQKRGTMSHRAKVSFYTVSNLVTITAWIISHLQIDYTICDMPKRVDTNTATSVFKFERLQRSCQQRIKQVLPGTANFAPRTIAGCCHLSNVMTWSSSHCPSILKVSWWQLQPFYIMLLTTRNLAIANKSPVSWAHNTSTASTVTPWRWNLG